MNAAIEGILIIVMAISGSLGALFFKLATDRLPEGQILTLLRIPQLYIGLLFYAVNFITNIVLLWYMPFTIVYPITALSYICTLLISRIVLKEPINREKVLAIMSIAAGVVVLSL